MDLMLCDLLNSVFGICAAFREELMELIKTAVHLLTLKTILQGVAGSELSHLSTVVQEL